MAAEHAGPPRFEGRAAFRQAIVDVAAAMAACPGPGRWIWVDVDFASWPLDDTVVRESLARWVRGPGVELVLLASGFDAVERLHPRFVAWRRLQAHRVTGRALDLEPADIPTLVLGPQGQGLQRIDAQRSRGRWWADDADVDAARAWCDALMQQSQPSFAANHLGL